ncbi:MAG: hypothetical protein Q9169_006684 [Polycauliona sp. 2 TL-2023]
MAGLLITGVGLAVAHHSFYRALNGRTAHSGANAWDKEDQAWSVRIGTALALLAKTCFAGAVAIAYQQQIWLDFRNTDYTLDGICAMFTAVNSVLSFFQWELLANAKVAMLLASTVWLLPLSALTASSALAIIAHTSHDIMVRDVPFVDFTRDALFSIGGMGQVAPALNRLAVSTGANAVLVPVALPIPNSSFDVHFLGPSLQCRTPSEVLDDRIVAEMIRNIHNATAYRLGEQPMADDGSVKSFGEVVSVRTQIWSTLLVGALNLTHTMDLPGSYEDKLTPSISLEDKGLARNLTLGPLIEELSRNLTVNFFSNPQNETGYRTLVNDSSTNNVYHYASRNLLVSYSIAITVTFMSVLLGLRALFLNGVAHSTSFAAILATTRSPSLATVAEGSSLGNEPMPKEMRRTRLQFGVLGSDDQGPGGTEITHSEWASEDAYSASAGSGISKPDGTNAPFKRLPFNFCAISLQPFDHPVCSPDGAIFDITNILPWLKKHGTNPVTGAPLKSTDLIKLSFTKNDEGEMVDPVTYKLFTNNTHIVALRNTSNVFAYDTIERLNIKAKNWQDLVCEEGFSRKDIITLQDPQNVESRNLSTFKYLQDGSSTLTPEQQRERNDPSRNVNKDALGNGASLFKPPKKEQQPDINPDALANNRASIAKTLSFLSSTKPVNRPATTNSSIPPNTSIPSTQPRALHTTGLAAASLTSTGLTPHTSADLASISLESYLLAPRRVRQKGYCLLTLHPLGPSSSSHQITLELHPEFAPKACWNFIELAKKGYYNDLLFHRNIPHFMLQGGDPTGTGKGGSSIWGKNFEDEFEGPLSMKFERRGMLAMANKGKNTNGSQFFITYRGTPHLVRKHTVFGLVVLDDDNRASEEALKALEKVEVDEKSRPETEIKIKDITVLVDPFERFLDDKEEREKAEREREEIRKMGGREDERVTWTGKRVRLDGGSESGNAEEGGGVGKYLKVSAGAEGGKVGAGAKEGKGVMEEWEGGEDGREKKKVKRSGFGNFDAW